MLSCNLSTCKVLKFNYWFKQLEWNKYVDLFVQFVSATKQFKFLLIDKHAGSVNRKTKLSIVFEK